MKSSKKKKKRNTMIHKVLRYERQNSNRYKVSSMCEGKECIEWEVCVCALRVGYECTRRVIKKSMQPAQ